MKKTINGKEVDIVPGANLRGADLHEANLRWANLGGADLSGANLGGADLRWANLCGASLHRANLGGANLSGANLGGADLSWANLHGANLSGANLGGADLCGADLRGANLCGANLHGANLHGANLSEANLRGATNIPPLFQAKSIIAGEGDLIGYKKLADGTICKLKIPADAKRSNSTGRKCRAEYAIVLEGDGFSMHNYSFEYKIGETVRPTEPFCEDRWNECTSGIHFFLTQAEAEAY